MIMRHEKTRNAWTAIAGCSGKKDSKQRRTGFPASQPGRSPASPWNIRADMLVIGSHGHTGLKDLIYGQTVNAVRHALKIPVLVVNL